MHEAITGELRYSGESFAELKAQIAQCESEEYKGIFGPMFTDIINRACAKSPSDRYTSVRQLREELELFLERRQAVLLRELGEEEYKKFAACIQGGMSAGIISSHFHRSRFAYEQALEIWREDTQSQKGLAALMLLSIHDHMQNQELDIVRELIKYVRPIGEEQRNRLKTLQKQYHAEQEERKRIQRLGVQYDFFPSSRSFVFVVLTFFCIIITMFLLLKSQQNLDPLDVTADLLFTHSILYLIPSILFLVLGRNILRKSLAARRVFSSIFSVIIIIFLHRWIAMGEEWLSPQIIAIDYFVLGAGFISCYPILQRGLLLAVLSFSIGIFNHLDPHTIWTGTGCFIIAASWGIGWDGWSLWKQSSQKYTASVA